MNRILQRFSSSDRPTVERLVLAVYPCAGWPDYDLGNSVFLPGPSQAQAHPGRVGILSAAFVRKAGHTGDFEPAFRELVGDPPASQPSNWDHNA